jgi:hypothetical protein
VCFQVWFRGRKDSRPAWSETGGILKGRQQLIMLAVILGAFLLVTWAATRDFSSFFRSLQSVEGYDREFARAWKTASPQSELLVSMQPDSYFYLPRILAAMKMSMTLRVSLRSSGFAGSPNPNRIRLGIDECDTKSYPDSICGAWFVCLVGISPCYSRYINCPRQARVARAGHISELKVL